MYAFSFILEFRKGNLVIKLIILRFDFIKTVTFCS